MELNKKSQDLLLIESCFRNIKTGQDVHNSIAAIQRVLKRMFDVNFNITIINNDTNQFFGMNIYPQKSTIDAIVEAILNKKSNTETLSEIWQKNTEWHLEIDSLLLYDNRLNANPSEITAVLLHEIGHVVHSNSIPHRVNKVMRYQIMNLDFTVKHLIRYDKIRKLFGIAVIEACTSKNFHRINSVNTEVVADKFVVKMGYGDELNNFITKLVSSQGNRLVERADHEIDGDIKSIVNWSIDNITELEFRKKKLRQSIQTEILKNPSIFVRSIFTDIKNAFFGAEEDNYKIAVAEQYLISGCQTVMRESILDIFDNIGKMKKVPQSDIDFLSIQVEKIENNDDKIYVLDLIYDKLDLVNAALEYIEKGKTEKVAQSKQTLTSLKTQLEKLRQQVLNIEIKDKQYGVFIKYPKGYEG